MKKAFDYFLVIIQLVLFAVYWWQPEKIAVFLPEIWKYTGMVLMGAGVLITLIAMLQLNKHITMLPSPTEQALLRTNGVFSIMRHPIYGGIIYFAIGFALYKLD
ncbi:MAG: isoprenylcysteine carboxylmethyltransferase family protein, partial [Fimbriimonadaceae bacterium]|nr:isoprenylcysteine carboxylmethyltransferase family protein [Chitinophagales bacterium]